MRIPQFVQTGLWFRLLFVLSLVTSVGLSAAWAGPYKNAANPAIGRGVSLYVPTMARDGLGAHIMVNAGEVDLPNVPSMLSEFHDHQGNRLVPSAEEPVEVMIVVPKGAPEEYRREFFESVRSQMSRLYPAANYKIEEAFLDVDDAKRKLMLDEAALVRKASAPETPVEIRETAQDVIQNIQEKAAELTQWKQNWFQRTWNASGGRVVEALNNHNPMQRTTIAQLVGYSKASVGFFVYISKYGLNPWSFAIAALNGAIVRALGYYAVEWSQWCTDHKFPGTDRFRAIRENPLVNWYNNSPEFKTTFINLLRTAGLAYLMRSMAHMTGQSIVGENGERVAVESPNTPEFWAGLAGLTTFELLSDAAMDVGLRMLRQKGKLTYMSQSDLLWGISMFDTVMHSFFRAGIPSVAYAIGSVTWSFRFGLYAIARFLKPEPRRFVFVSPHIPTAPVEVEKKGWLASLRSRIPFLRSKAPATVEHDERAYIRGRYTLMEAENIAFTEEQLKLAVGNIDEKDFRKLLTWTQKDTDRYNEIWERKQREGENFDLRAACVASLSKRVK